MNRTVISLCFCLLIATNAHAGNPRWPFDVYPQPAYEDLTEKELAILDESERVEPADGGPCMEYVRAYYKIYTGRYPEYGSWSDEKTRFEAWLTHVTESRPKQVNPCYSSYLLTRIFEIDHRISSLKFCGRLTRHPDMEIETEAAKLAKDLFRLATISPRGVAVDLITVSKSTRFIELDPEIEYYFAELSKEGDREPPSQATIDYLASKPSEYRERLDKAVTERDIETALEMAGECGTD